MHLIVLDLKELKKHEFNCLRTKKAQKTWVSLLNMLKKRKKHGFIFESSKNMDLILDGIWFWKFRRHEFNCLQAKKC